MIKKEEGIKIVTEDPFKFKDLPKQIQNEKEVALAAVKKDGLVLEIFPEFFKSDWL